MLTTTFIDTHCHLDFEQFADILGEIITAATQAGVSRFVVPSVDLASAQRLPTLAQRFPAIAIAVGVHPWWVAREAVLNDEAQFTATLRALLPTAVAVGETGLDAMIETPLAQQVRALHLQLALAREFRLPVILHSRKTHSQLLREIKVEGVDSGGVIHGFSGSYEEARAFIDAGFYIGVGGVVTYSRANKTRLAIARLPLDALVLESDAPDMPHAGRQGQINRPEWVPEVAKVVADLRGVTVEEIAFATTINAQRLFRL